MTTPTVLIIGAGPAGLSAAIAAARAGAAVVVLEKNDAPGKKLLLTGGGRANLVPPPYRVADIIDAFGRDGRALRQVLTAFDYPGFLDALGIELENEPGGTYVAGGAKRLLSGLLTEAKRYGVRIVFNAPVHSISKQPDGRFSVQTPSDGFIADRLAIATGGITYPITGSTGDGYTLAATLGCDLLPPRPALGGIATAPAFPDLAGLSIERATIQAAGNGLPKSIRQTGAILFTHRGISGPAILDLSIALARQFDSPNAISGLSLSLDSSPDATLDELVARAQRAAVRTPRKTIISGDWAEIGRASCRERV